MSARGVVCLVVIQQAAATKHITGVCVSATLNECVTFCRRFLGKQAMCCLPGKDWGVVIAHCGLSHTHTHTHLRECLTIARPTALIQSSFSCSHASAHRQAQHVGTHTTTTFKLWQQWCSRSTAHRLTQLIPTQHSPSAVPFCQPCGEHQHQSGPPCQSLQ